MQRRRRGFATLAAALAVALLLGAGAIPSGAQASFFYEIAAQASPVYVSIERDGYILNPILQANALESKANANSTGTRQGFASLLNPGAIGGFPALLGLAISGLPPIPYPGYPLSVAADHPAVPEKHVGVGAVPVYDADKLDAGAFGAGALYAQAKAADDRASGDGVGGELSLGGGVVRVGAVRSSTKVVEDGAGARATARTRLTNVEILDLIQIPAIEAVTEVVANADGTTTTSSLTVGAVKALGANAVIDDKGVRITGLPGVPDIPPVSLDALNEQLAKALSQQGVTVRLLQGETGKAPADGVTAAGGVGTALQISYSLVVPDSVPIPNVPGVPLGVPLGGGIPTVATVALARTAGTGVSGVLGDLSGAPGGSEAGDDSAAAGSGPADFGALTGLGESGGVGPGVTDALPGPGVGGAPGVTGGAAATSPGVPGAVGGEVALAGQRTASLAGSFGWVLALAVAAALAVATQTRRRVQRLRAVPWRGWIQTAPRRTR